METFLRRNFKVEGNIASLFKPNETTLTKLIEGIEVQLWHKAPMEKIFLASGLTNTDGNFSIEFEVNSPVNYIVDGKISDVFLETYYNGVKIEQATSENLLAGMVAYWKMDETSGTEAVDATSNDHTASLAGATLPDWVTGKIGNGLMLNGNPDGSGSSYITVPSGADFNFGSADFTYSLWIKPDNTSVGYALFDAGYGYTNGFYSWYEFPGTLTIYSNASLIYSRTYTLEAGESSHIVIRRISGEIELFINGTGLGKETFVDNVECTIPNLLFGQYSGGGVNLSGTLDEIGIWKGHGLTDAEVSKLYNAGEGLQYPF